MKYLLEKNKEKNKGFTLLFASLIVSLLLGVGLAILQITLQQLILSSAGKESQFAFYNADTGIECALYRDNKGPGFFATDTPSISNSNAYNNLGFTCADQNATIVKIESSPIGSPAATTTFSIIIDPNMCQVKPGESYEVTVSKYINANGNSATKIQSRGYDTCDLSNIRRVERGLEVDY